MKTKALLKKLSNFFPKSIAKKYHDYPGLQTGKLKEEVKTILLCLDFDEIVFNKMKEADLLDKVDLIITHHPFIYGKKKYVFLNDQNKEKLCSLIDSYNIPICSYHTNFDEGIKETIRWNLENQDWLRHVESGEYRKWMERYKGLEA